jgi:hypothetical protein
MSAYTMHTSEEIWGPDARVFNPDRWLTPAAKSLEQYLCTFSKGARMCLGQKYVEFRQPPREIVLYDEYALTIGFIVLPLPSLPLLRHICSGRSK